ncbi:DUF222 domain-containing protein [Georgenia sp. Z1491]|uniref:DUF222 domain-containing protein n=1 Tax=Georgenia sp. Z1491 TaxID=3416707 RepID=UPI003CF816F2
MAEDVGVDQGWSALEELLSAQIEAWLAKKAAQNDAASESDADAETEDVSDAVGCDAETDPDADADVEDVGDRELDSPYGTGAGAATDSDDDRADLDEETHDLPAAVTLTGDDEDEQDPAAAPALTDAAAAREQGVALHVGEPLSSVGVVGGMRGVVAQLDALSQARVGDLSGQEAIDLLESIEAAERRLTALRATTTAKVETDGLWALDGQRSFRTWLRDRTGTSAAVAGRQARQARALRDDLPLAHGALCVGRISVEHVQVLVRETLSTDRLRTQLADTEMGEGFLVAQAQVMHAQDFARLVAAWKVRADPAGADKAWREDDAREELTIAPTTGGYHLTGWLDELSGQVVTTALTAHAGRKGADDDRSPAQRRAGALVALAHESLDRGGQLAGARVRPHVTITATLETLTALTRATGSVIPPASATAGWNATHDLTPDAVRAYAGLPEGQVVGPITAAESLTAPGGPRDPHTRTHTGSSAGAASVTAPGAANHDGSAPRPASEGGAGVFELSDEARQWLTAWQPGEDHVISAAIDPRVMTGTQPAASAIVSSPASTLNTIRVFFSTGIEGGLPMVLILLQD